mmetsp:Transcript_10521/g.15926  ORF Transcript_10521/g.15926 Transcript_10521/m.15926 type:complete len:84 (-) Transcript_10521:1472-1723(-)
MYIIQAHNRSFQKKCRSILQWQTTERSEASAFASSSSIIRFKRSVLVTATAAIAASIFISTDIGMAPRSLRECSSSIGKITCL